MCIPTNVAMLNMNMMFIYSMTTLLKIHTIYVQISFQPEAVMEIPFGWLGRNAEGIGISMTAWLKTITCTFKIRLG